MNELSSRYAQALFSLSLEKDCLLKWKNEVRIIKDVLLENKEYLKVISSSFLPLEKRLEMVRKTFKSFDEEILNFICIIISNHRVMYLIDIFNAFNSLGNEQLGILEGIIYSSELLNKKQIDEIECSFSKKMNVKVELKNKVDETLIGGVKVVLKDQVFDGSIKAKLDDLKTKLLKGGITNGNKN